MVCHLQNGVTDNNLLVLLGLITDQILIKGLVINTLSGRVITHMTAARDKFIIISSAKLKHEELL